MLHLKNLNWKVKNNLFVFYIDIQGTVLQSLYIYIRFILFTNLLPSRMQCQNSGAIEMLGLLLKKTGSIILILTLYYLKNSEETKTNENLTVQDQGYVVDTLRLPISNIFYCFFRCLSGVVVDESSRLFCWLLSIAFFQFPA